MSGAHLEKLPDPLRECITACWDCRHVCQMTLFSHCLAQGGAHLEPSHVKLMTDCIEMCQTAADFMVRQSDMHMATCNACADICDACAISCDDLGPSMKECAEACRRCAQSCRVMGGIGGFVTGYNWEESSGIMA